MIYVDTLVVHPNAWGPFLEGSCHMTADSKEELHDFAKKIGLKRSWFQDDGKRKFWHYDLTPSKRTKAVRLGATEVTAVELYKLCLKRRKLEES